MPKTPANGFTERRLRTAALVQRAKSLSTIFLRVHRTRRMELQEK